MLDIVGVVVSVVDVVEVRVGLSDRVADRVSDGVIEAVSDGLRDDV